MNPYGRRPPYRRRDRLGFACTAWLVIFGAILGAAVVLSARAHADPVSTDVAVYAAQNAGPVCSTLDDYPSIPGLQGVLAGVQDDGFSGYQSGQIVALAVQARCPRFLPLLQQFVNLNTPSPVHTTPPVTGSVIA